jgi:hypothetical protein
VVVRIAPQTIREIVVGERPLERVGERHGVADRDDQAGVFVPDQIVVRPRRSSRSAAGRRGFDQRGRDASR